MDMVYFASGNFWLLGGRIITTGSGLILTIAFANLLPPETFGAYKYILAVAGFIAAFTLNGLGAAALRAIGKGYQDAIPSVFRSALLWSLPASAVALTGGGYYLFMGNPTLGWSLVVIAIFNPLLSNLSLTKSLFVATGDFKRATYYNIIRVTFQTFIIILSLLLTKNVFIVATTYFVASSLIGYITYLHSLKALKIKDDPTHAPATTQYAIHMSALGALQLVAGQLDQLLLWHFASPVALAMYAIALGPTRELRSLSENINAIAFPKMAQKTRSDASLTVRKRSRHLFFVYVFIVIAYIFAAPYLFKFLFPQYLDAVFPSQLLALGMLFQSRLLADLFLLSHGTVKDRYAITVPAQVLKIVLMFALIPPFGLYGAIVATLCSEVCTAVMIAYTYRTHRQAIENGPTL